MSTKQSVKSNIIKLPWWALCVNYAESPLPIIVHWYSAPWLVIFRRLPKCISRFPWWGRVGDTVPLRVHPAAWRREEGRSRPPHLHWWKACVFSRQGMVLNPRLPQPQEMNLSFCSAARWLPQMWSHKGGFAEVQKQGFFLAKELKWGQIPGNHELTPFPFPVFSYKYVWTASNVFPMLLILINFIKFIILSILTLFYF